MCRLTAPRVARASTRWLPTRRAPGRSDLGVRGRGGLGGGGRRPVDGRYAECEKVILVCDNLNTHTKGAFYEVFEPARARELVRRLEFLLHAETRQTG